MHSQSTGEWPHETWDMVEAERQPSLPRGVSLRSGCGLAGVVRTSLQERGIMEMVRDSKLGHLP